MKSRKRKKPATQMRKLANEKVIRAIVRNEIHLIAQTYQKDLQKKFQDELITCLTEVSLTPYTF